MYPAKCPLRIRKFMIYVLPISHMFCGAPEECYFICYKTICKNSYICSNEICIYSAILLQIRQTHKFTLCFPLTFVFTKYTVIISVKPERSKAKFLLKF